MNNKMMQGMLLELWMVTVFRGDGVIVGSLELGLSQHQPCMPEWKDEAIGPSSDHRCCCVLFGTNWYTRLPVTGNLFV